MHIPSERVRQEMISEAASLWFVPANDGTELAVLIKAPTPSIKALIAGCPLKLVFGIMNSYLCTGAIIVDVPDAPLIISGVQRNQEEHNALARFLNELTAPIFLFNEMDICVAWSNIRISKECSDRVVKLAAPFTDLYVGTFNDELSYALDCFGHSLGNISLYPNASQIPIEEINSSLEEWHTITNYFYGENEYHPVVISNPDEGKAFEETIWASLSSVFPNSLYKNSLICNGQKKREFTDILTTYPYGSFLIEAKDLSVFNAGYERGQTRRLSGVQKQVRKAITQLVGACKDFADGKDIYSSDNTLLSIDRTQPPHCIVLITELIVTGDWSDIVVMLCDAMTQTGALFHLLDLQEFISLLKGSSGKPELLDYNLIKRCELFLEKKSVFIRSVPPTSEPK